MPPTAAIRPGEPRSRDARPAIAAAFGTHSTGWGASWVDLDLDGNLDLVVANGAIPVTNLAKNASQVQVLENVSDRAAATQFVSAGPSSGYRAYLASTDAGSRRRTTTTTATSMSRSTRSAEGCSSSATTAHARPLARGAAARLRAREPSSRPSSPTVAGSSGRCSRARATCPPKIRACTSASASATSVGAPRALPRRRCRPPARTSRSTGSWIVDGSGSR